MCVCGISLFLLGNAAASLPFNNTVVQDAAEFLSISQKPSATEQTLSKWSLSLSSSIVLPHIYSSPTVCYRIQDSAVEGVATRFPWWLWRVYVHVSTIHPGWLSRHVAITACSSMCTCSHTRVCRSVRPQITLNRTHTLTDVCIQRPISVRWIASKGSYSDA